MSQSSSKLKVGIEAAAAQWVARRDRTLTASEQDEYLQWLQEDPRHAAAIARHERTLDRMMQLADWQPGHEARPNPDLFAPRSRWQRWTKPWMALAAAAVVAGSTALWWKLAGPGTAAAPSDIHLRVNERQTLVDGSVVELKDGSQLDVKFTDETRRVHLRGGEGFFHVAKNAARPFIVEAGGVEVRAVGTAFNVRLDASTVEVLVTEGRVRLASRIHPETALTFLRAGECAIVPLQPDQTPANVVHMTDEEIKSALAWQVPRLQFYETPLSDAVEEFNRRGTESGRPVLVIGDPSLADLRVGGTFRVDNVRGFVRLLSVTMGIRSEPGDGNKLVLVRGR